MRFSALTGLRQLLSRPRERSLRLGQLRAQRRHQRSQDLIPRTSVIARHTGTLLPPATAHAAIGIIALSTQHERNYVTIERT